MQTAPTMAVNRDGTGHRDLHIELQQNHSLKSETTVLHLRPLPPAFQNPKAKAVRRNVDAPYTCASIGGSYCSPLATHVPYQAEPKWPEISTVFQADDRLAEVHGCYHVTDGQEPRKVVRHTPLPVHGDFLGVEVVIPTIQGFRRLRPRDLLFINAMQLATGMLVPRKHSDFLT